MSKQKTRYGTDTKADTKTDTKEHALATITDAISKAEHKVSAQAREIERLVAKLQDATDVIGNLTADLTRSRKYYSDELTTNRALNTTCTELRRELELQRNAVADTAFMPLHYDHKGVAMGVDGWFTLSLMFLCDRPHYQLDYKMKSGCDDEGRQRPVIEKLSRERFASIKSAQDEANRINGIALRQYIKVTIATTPDDETQKPADTPPAEPTKKAKAKATPAVQVNS